MPKRLSFSEQQGSPIVQDFTPDPWRDFEGYETTSGEQADAATEQAAYAQGNDVDTGSDYAATAPQTPNSKYGKLHGLYAKAGNLKYSAAKGQYDEWNSTIGAQTKNPGLKEMLPIDALMNDSRNNFDPVLKAQWQNSEQRRTYADYADKWKEPKKKSFFKSILPILMMVLPFIIPGLQALGPAMAAGTAGVEAGALAGGTALGTGVGSEALAMGAGLEGFSSAALAAPIEFGAGLGGLSTVAGGLGATSGFSSMAQIFKMLQTVNRVYGLAKNIKALTNKPPQTTFRRY